MCEASNLSAVIEFEKVPLLNKAAMDYYLAEKCIPGGTIRNFDSYGHKIEQLSDYQRNILCDPQTSGGLLVAVKQSKVADFKNILRGYDLDLEPIGHFVKQQDKLVSVV